MRKLKKIVAYIFRSWKDEPGYYTHPRIKILPPFLWELLVYLMVIALLLSIGLTIFKSLQRYLQSQSGTSSSQVKTFAFFGYSFTPFTTLQALNTLLKHFPFINSYLLIFIYLLYFLSWKLPALYILLNISDISKKYQITF